MTTVSLCCHPILQDCWRWRGNVDTAFLFYYSMQFYPDSVLTIFGEYFSYVFVEIPHYIRPIFVTVIIMTLSVVLLGFV